MIDPLLDAARAELSRKTEPIAVVGLAFRLPNTLSEEADLWSALSSSFDASAPLDLARFPQGGKFRASLVQGIDRFDNAYFSISSIEASVLDPQQRLALEVAAESDASAGNVRSTSSVGGVFLGSTHEGYLYAKDLPTETMPFQVTGELGAAISGRVSYFFGANGPSLVVDTACSSSLVSIHLAVQSLRAAECDFAFAGGVTLHFSGERFARFASMTATSDDGRSKSFDASADGYGRGEGCGILMLKRLSDAQRDGDRIRAVILGTAVNQDGRSTSLSAPSGLAQQEVLAQALLSSGLGPTDVQYVEAHGTGTILGDPIEVEALTAVYGAERTAANPLIIGTLKTNIGHLEYAAGVAGVLKVILSIRHRRLPPNLHFKNPNPHIPWESTPIRVQTELTPWPEPSKPLVAGVSSFGITGTNAHVIISEPPAEPEEKWSLADAEAVRGGLVLPLAISAKVPKALREYVERFIAMLEGPEDETYRTTWRDVSHTTTVRRQHMEERLVVVGKSKEEWRNKLRSFLGGEEGTSGIAQGNGKETKTRIAFVFSGQGPQWFAMGRELFKDPVFKKSIRECSQITERLAGWSVEDELLKSEKESRLADTSFAQPCIVALQIGLLALYRHWDISPSVVVGHSIGEVSACYAAGVFSLEDTMRLAIVRGRIMRKATGLGKMASISLSENGLLPFLSGGSEISVAAVNSPCATVVSGTREGVDRLLAVLAKEGIQTKELRVDYAFHSEQVAPFIQELETELSSLSLSPRAPSTRIVSTLTGKEETGVSFAFTPAYWAKQMRGSVRFLDATKALLDSDYDLFLELSPHPVLTAAIDDTALEEKKKVCVTYSLRRNIDDRESTLTSLAQLHAYGYPVDWKKAFHNDEGIYVWGRVAELPNYPWQRQRYWLPEKKEKTTRRDSRWPFIHSHTESSSRQGEHVFHVEFDLSDENFAYLKDHKVQGSIWFPGAGYIEMALEVGTELLASKFSGVTALVLKESMVLSETDPTLVQLTVSPPDDKGTHPFSVASKPKSDAQAAWTTHATGLLSTERLTPGDMPRLQDVRTRIKQAGGQEKTSQELYAAFENIDLSYGPAFQGILSLSSENEEALAKLKTPESLPSISLKSYRAHPSLLDAAFQASTGALAALKVDQTFVPAAAQHIRTVQNTGNDAVIAFAKLRSKDPKNPSVDVYLLDKDGKLLTEVIGLVVKPIGRTQDRLDKWMWDITWKTVPNGTTEDTHGPWLLLEDTSSTGKELRALLEKKGQKVVSFPTNSTDPDAYLLLFKKHFPNSPPRKIVHLAALGVADGLSLDACKQGEELGCLTALFLVQAIQKMLTEGGGWSVPPKLFLVTRGAQPPVLSPAQAMLWGLGACLPHEMPELNATLIDLSTSSSSADLLTELTHQDSENRVALRSEDGQPVRKAQRLTKHQPKEKSLNPTRSELTVSNTLGYRLDPIQRGNIHSLSLQALKVPAPGPGQVLIRTETSALNFRDVLMALGLYPGLSDERLPMGGECAGTIIALGDGVDELAVGDRVVAVGKNAFDSHILASKHLTLPIPKQLTPEQACAIPLVYMTTLFALRDYGRLAKGDSILIHAATGGVGIAAIQYAKYVGATILATAGSEEKRNYLRNLGIEHVFDSRSFDWVDGALKATGGKGVDVLLNSLAKDAIPKGLSILAPFGRFLELGKRDIYEHSNLDMYPLSKSTSIAGVMLDLYIDEQPEKARALFKETLALFENGCFSPPPVTTFPVSKAADAFFFLQRAKQIGKVALSHEPSVSIVDTCPVPTDKTILISGGYGGLAPTIIKTLAELGARHFALVGRSGASPQTKAILDSLSQQFQATFYPLKADISSAADAELLPGALKQLGAPKVHSIVHAAVVLNDATFQNQNKTLFRNAIAPKVDGLLNLLQSLAPTQLILFSSISGLLGNGGQANYAAANAFLDATAHFRSQLKLPSLALNWGPWADVGAATSAAVTEHLHRQGMLSIVPNDGAELLKRSLTQSSGTQLSPFPLNFAAFKWSQSAIFSDIASPGTSGGSLHGKLHTLPQAHRIPFLTLEIRKIVASLARVPFEQVLPSANLKELGFDSLLMISLRNKLLAELNVSTSTAKLYAFRTLEDLAAFMVPPENGPHDSTPEAAPRKIEITHPESSADEPEAAALVELDELSQRIRSRRRSARES